jgi:hypothetical protein
MVCAWGGGGWRWGSFSQLCRHMLATRDTNPWAVTLTLTAARLRGEEQCMACKEYTPCTSTTCTKDVGSVTSTRWQAWVKAGGWGWWGGTGVGHGGEEPTRTASGSQALEMDLCTTGEKGIPWPTM